VSLNMSSTDYSLALLVFFIGELLLTHTERTLTASLQAMSSSRSRPTCSSPKSAPPSTSRQSCCSGALSRSHSLAASPLRHLLASVSFLVSRRVDSRLVSSIFCLHVSCVMQSPALTDRVQEAGARSSLHALLAR